MFSNNSFLRHYVSYNSSQRIISIAVCDFCEEEYLDVCSKCGGLVSLEENPVPRGTEDRAMKTAPKGVLEVRRSEIHGFGVFALKNLRKGLRLGPYDGSITRIDTQNGYAWKMRDGRLIDANDTRNSNYLRYVNCPRKAEEQNLVAFQYKGSLYYRTCRDISKGEELLVFYGVSFARNLGIDPKKYFEPEEEKTMPDFYTCKFCSIGLGTEKFRDTHQKYCRFDPKKMRRYEGEVYQCQFCKCGNTTKEFLERHERKCSKREGNIQIDGKKNHSCLYCEKGFTYKSQLYVHVIEIHEKENTQVNSCWNCDSKNIFIHGSDQLNRCQNCGKSFQIKKFRKLFSCEHCEYKTVNSSAFNKHQLKHKKPATKYGFDLCSYTSSYGKNLKKHLLIHSGYFPYFCTECKKIFNKKQELDGHILKNHIDNETLMSSISNKIHHCEFCEYKTVNSIESTIHQLKHNKDNIAPSYHCQECNFSSFWKGSFETHSRIHSKNFPYLCNGCEKRFNHKISLDSHILNNHRDNQTLVSSISNRILHCECCNYQTIRSSDLKRHTKKHNKNI
ncbi:unnamed protein product [Phaedon cochleariae]|uniref:Uncharacterized protein n=1 Tax=Phaedon cochleariae TaxID=80249 RepID=A0A9P0GRQ3_PHACE|nr:unnamed protein product [Phaedon cochleariae]